MCCCWLGKLLDCLYFVWQSAYLAVNLNVLGIVIVVHLIYILTGLWESRDPEGIQIPCKDGSYVPQSPHWRSASHRCNCRRMLSQVVPGPWNTEMSGPNFTGQMTLGQISNSPNGVMTTVLGMSKGSIRIWWYAQTRSNFEKIIAPCHKAVEVLDMWGIVALFNTQ